MQNGRLVAIIDFNMRDIWKTMPDSWTITTIRCNTAVLADTTLYTLLG